MFFKRKKRLTDEEYLAKDMEKVFGPSRIIKDGKAVLLRDSITAGQHTCERCDCEFVYSPKDVLVTEKSSGRTFRIDVWEAWISCPQCITKKVLKTTE